MSTAIHSNRDQTWIRGVPVTWPLEKMIYWTLPFLVVFFNSADFRGNTGEQFEVHWQILLRLLICMLCGALGALVLFPKTYRDFLTWPGLLLLFEIVLYGLSQLTSVQINYTMAAWVSYICVVLMIPASMRILGGNDFLKSVFAGLIVYLVGSWIAYIVFPEIGVHKEYTTGSDSVQRMGGLGHPNELGIISAYATLLAAGMLKTRRMHPLMCVAAMGLGALTLLTCFSRTATACCMLGLATIFWTELRRMGNAYFYGLFVMAGCVVAYVATGMGWADIFLQNLVGKITKSGSIDELSTATGRTDIWTEAFRLISESPALGYGYCGARFVMEDFSYHAHNIVLNAAIYAGIFASMVILAMIFVIIRGILLRPDPVIDGLAVCMLAGGMLEGLLGAPSPAASVTIWICILLWRPMNMDQTSLAGNEKLA